MGAQNHERHISLHYLKTGIKLHWNPPPPKNNNNKQWLISFCMLPTESFFLNYSTSHKHDCTQACSYIHSSMQDTFRYPHRVWLHYILQVAITTSIDIYTVHIQPAHVHANTHTHIHTHTHSYWCTHLDCNWPLCSRAKASAAWSSVTRRDNSDGDLNKQKFLHLPCCCYLVFFKPRTLVIFTWHFLHI